MPHPTMHDVARLAGVSVTTVSRSINNGRYVRDSTRDRVEAAIAELGFQRNDIARTLRPGQSTATLALVIEDVGNPFYSGITRGVEEVAQANQHLLVVGTTQASFDRERELLAELSRRRVDGLLVVPADGEHAELVAEVGRWTPLVFVDRAPRGVAVDAVVLDNRGGARQAVDHLIVAGHERIAYVGGNPAIFTGTQRLAGYKYALRRAGLTPDDRLISLDHHTSEDARTAVLALLASRQPPTAIFADNNRMLVGTLQAVATLECPVGLAGFDELELAELLPVPVALVSYRTEEIGRAAAGLLLDRIHGDSSPPRRITLRTTLVHRGRGW